MQKKKAHFMIVGTHEHPLGIVTLEDILEEVFGDFIDEVMSILGSDPIPEEVLVERVKFLRSAEAEEARS